jgi:3-dehydroquinate dehydratase/shikimate dehydrogenase
MSPESSSVRPLICIPITDNDAEAFLKSVGEAADFADAIELRTDYLMDSNPIAILKAVGSLEKVAQKPLILTSRPREQGGFQEIDFRTRQTFWENFDDWDRIAFADIELDMVEQLMQTTFPLPWEKVICSWHNFDETPDDIEKIFDRITRTPSAVVKIAAKANRLNDCLKIFDLIDRAKSLSPPRQVIALGMEMPGVMTRILALSRGAMLTFGSLRRGAESASGQPTADELKNLYRADKLTRDSLVMGVMGHPIGHSRSPLIHNTALAALNVDGVYLPLEVDDVNNFVRDFVRPATRKMDWNLRGLSVTIPHKLSILPHLDFIDATAKAIGAVNTVVIEGNELHGYNTDVAGAMKPLEDLLSVRDARAAVIGAGGAARAIVYGLKQRGADVTIYARDVAKAQALADEFKVTAVSLTDFSGNLDLVINCTPVGMKGRDELLSPLPAEHLHKVKLVYDLIYNPLETQLLEDAKATGCQTLGGMAMLISQAAEQFRLWTGKQMPMDLITRALTAR